MATLFDSASLVMIPSGYKDDKLYSIKPTNGDGDFTFSRDGAGASPATRVNASGIIEKGRENELTYSNDFSNAAWQKGGVTETGGQSDKDGGTDAWLLSKSGQYSYIRQLINKDSVFTFSVYAKADSYGWMLMHIEDASGDAIGNFNLSSGSLGTITGSIDAKIESVGNGWYRCSVTCDKNTTDVRIYPNSENGYSGTSGTIYIQDAQLEEGLVATEYIETTTAPVAAGILGDMPRLDYSGGASCPSLLLEPSRTNLLPHSEYFNTWNGSDVSPEPNTSETLSPEGLFNSYKVTTNIYGSLFRDSISVSAETKYTFTFYAKGGTMNTPKLAIRDDSNGVFIVEDVAYTISTDSWKRITQTITTPVGCTSLRVYPLRGSMNGTMYLYGAQVEQGSYPTSYIPTYGSAALRGADSCSKTGISSLIGQTSGTIFAEFEALSTAQDGGRIIAIGDGTTSNRIVAFEGSNNIRFFAATGGVTQLDYVSGTTFSGTHKIAISYSENNTKIFIDGALATTDTSISIPATSAVYLGTPEGVGAELGGDVKQALLFPTALTDAECISLTTI